MKNSGLKTSLSATAVLPWLLLLLSCVCFVSTLQAQPLPDRRTLSGVVKGSDGQPVAQAVVTVRRQDDLNAVAFWGAQVATNAQGEFSVPDAEEGSYYITVEAPTFAPVYNSSYILSPISTPVQVKLVRLVNLTLQVLKPDGLPLVKSKAFMRLRGGDQSQRTPVSVTTDAAGLVQKGDMMPGAYSLHVLAPGTGYAVLNNVNVKFSAKPEPVVVRLKTGGTLRVTARESAADNAGRPLGGATFTMFAVPVGGGAQPPRPTHSAQIVA
jgi:hypothetical protein